MQVGTTRRHGELLDDLVVLFLAEGFADFTLADLADRMRCSKTTLYALGHSKEALVRNVLIHFFSRAAEEIERRTAAEPDPAARITVYLNAVADELRPASPRFFADLAAKPDARAVYERNTEIAAQRVSEMIAAGVADGTFREVDVGFVGDLVATEITRIQGGEVRARTGVGDAEAYEALAAVVLNGISR